MFCYVSTETSYTYAQFQRSGTITAPATSIPRFKKYSVDDFHFLTVLGKGSFGKVIKQTFQIESIKPLYSTCPFKMELSAIWDLKSFNLMHKRSFLCLFCHFAFETNAESPLQFPSALNNSRKKNWCLKNAQLK